MKNTLIYTHLVNFKSDEITVKVAETIQEACKLVEADSNTSPAWMDSKSSGKENKLQARNKKIILPPSELFATRPALAKNQRW